MNTKHEGEGQRSWQEAWDLALDHKGIMYQLLYKYVRSHGLPFYTGEALQKELESFAWEGFFEACRQWDEAKGTLTTYAYPSITNAMDSRMKVLERMGSNMQGHYKKGEGPLTGGAPRPKLSSLEQLDERRQADVEMEEGNSRSIADIYTQPWQGEEPSLEDTVIDAIHQAETVDRIKGIVDSMPDPHKTIFTLMYLTEPTHDRRPKRGLGSGYTLSEVAKHFRRDTTWARKQLDEALDYIRFQLDAQGEEYE